jgi:uncharacterized protein YecE (DUF72 family)
MDLAPVEQGSSGRALFQGKPVVQAGKIRIGTSGWIYNHWRGVFYPPQLPVKRWFAFYSRHFDTVEINNTFYRLPDEQVFRAWRQQAPGGFVYAVKASRFLTHMKKLKDPAESLERILGRARRLGPHLGPILFQLPPHWQCDAARLHAFAACLPGDLQHVLEFRDLSWCADTIHDILTRAGISFCMHDSHGLRWPQWVTGPIVYVRFHGPQGERYAGRYPRAHLRLWAERIRSLQQTGHDVYAYFNNDREGHAVTNARELREMLAIAAPAPGAGSELFVP